MDWKLWLDIWGYIIGIYVTELFYSESEIGGTGNNKDSNLGEKTVEYREKFERERERFLNHLKSFKP